MVTISPKTDTLTEGPETVKITLAAASGYTVDATKNTATVTIADVPPVTLTLTAPAAQTAAPGLSKAFALGTLAATNAKAPYKVTVKWGDGTADTVFTMAAAGALAAQSHKYAASGTDSVTVTAADAAGHSASTTLKVVVSLPVVLPTVAIVATDAAASEAGDAGLFTVTRTGSTAKALTVNYTVSGTASNGTDYAILSGVATIAAGSLSSPVTVTPTWDWSDETTETVIVSIKAASTYNVDTLKKTATVTIANVAPNPTLTGIVADDTVMGQLTLKGRFNPAATTTIVRVTCADGFTCDLTPDIGSLTASSMTASVPFHADKVTGSVTASTATVQVLQTFSGKTWASTKLPGLKVPGLPTSRAPAGTVVLNVLKAQLSVLNTTKAKLVAPDNTAALKAALDKRIADAQAALAYVQGLVDGTSTSVKLATVAGSPIALTRSSLAVADQFFVAKLLAESAAYKRGLTASAVDTARPMAAASDTAGAFASAAQSNSNTLGQAAQAWMTGAVNWLHDPGNNGTIGRVVAGVAIAGEVVAFAAAAPAIATATGVVGAVWAGTELVLAAHDYLQWWQTMNPTASQSYISRANDELFQGAVGFAGNLSAVYTDSPGTGRIVGAIINYKSLQQAKYEAEQGAVTVTSTVSSAASDGDGTVAAAPATHSDGQYHIGDPVTFTAHYTATSKVDYWTVNGVKQSTTADTLSVTLAGNTAVVVHFKDTLAGSYSGSYHLSDVNFSDDPDDQYTITGDSSIKLVLTKTGQGTYSATATLNGLKGSENHTTNSLGSHVSDAILSNSTYTTQTTVNVDSKTGQFYLLLSIPYVWRFGTKSVSDDSSDVDDSDETLTLYPQFATTAGGSLSTTYHDADVEGFSTDLTCNLTRQ